MMILGLMRSSDLSEKERVEYLRDLYELLARMKWLIETMLSLSRIDAASEKIHGDEKMSEPASERFYNITMTSRLCYIFMCIERYLTTLYPERDWTPEAPGEKERGWGEFENTEYLSVILNKKAGGKCP